MLDDQTANGKLIKGVINLGNKHDIPVLAISGKSNFTHERHQSIGLKDAIQIWDANQPKGYMKAQQLKNPQKSYSGVNVVL